jgi:hypothetical protein
MSVRWEGVDDMKTRMDEYERLMMREIKNLAQRWAVELENYAKQNRPWQDQTHAAKLGLHGWVDVMIDLIRINLSHGVEYGSDLELKWSGKYAIIWPTIEAHLDEIRRSIETAFGT